MAGRRGIEAAHFVTLTPLPPQPAGPIPCCTMTRGEAMQAVLTVDLGAVAANWRLLRDRAAPGAAAGVVKADAYGLGAAPVARALPAAGCRHFVVAHLAEGMALRAAIGPGPMIAVLNGFAPGADEAPALLPILNGLGDIAAWRAA